MTSQCEEMHSTDLQTLGKRLRKSLPWSSTPLRLANGEAFVIC